MEPSRRVLRNQHRKLNGRIQVVRKHAARRLHAWLIFDVSQKMKLRVLLGAVLIFAGCVAPYTRTKRMAPLAHRFVELQSVGDGSLGGWSYYSLVDEVIIFDKGQHFRLKPEIAAAAWREIDALDVFSWKDRYVAEDIGSNVSDGGQWFLWAKVDSREKRSSGYQVYPALASVGTTTFTYDLKTRKPVDTACHKLFGILSSLSKRANKAPEPTTMAVTPRAMSRIAK